MNFPTELSARAMRATNIMVIQCAGAIRPLMEYVRCSKVASALHTAQ